jgi:hypothetical protein
MHNSRALAVTFWLIAAVGILESESTCPADEASQAPVQLEVAIASEREPLTVEVTLHFNRVTLIYLHDRFGLEEQLGSYLEIFFERDGVQIELASFSPKTMYPSKKYLRKMKAGQSIKERFVLSPDSTFYYRTPPRYFETLPHGRYLLTASYTVPDDEISSRLGISPISATAVPIQMTVE